MIITEFFMTGLSPVSDESHDTTEPPFIPKYSSVNIYCYLVNNEINQKSDEITDIFQEIKIKKIDTRKRHNCILNKTVIYGKSEQDNIERYIKIYTDYLQIPVNLIIKKKWNQ